jgi:glutaredoxin 2
MRFKEFMTLTLYHYVHCPYSVRVRMALGYLNLDFTSKVLPYEDEATPVALIGKKMLPILVHDQQVLNESLDIIEYIDKNNELKVSEVINSETFLKVEEYLNTIGGPIHSLAMPYWIYTPEFSEASRRYFQKKKEEKRGSFSTLVKNRFNFESEVQLQLKSLEKSLIPFYESSTFGLLDILIASHLWGLYVVPEFHFSEKMQDYLKTIKNLCRFNYHKDFWG